jgi:hypothetical protein
MVRFARTTNALDQLADALQRADATWRGGAVVEWEQLSEAEQDDWRALARAAATTVVDEIRLSDGGR